MTKTPTSKEEAALLAQARRLRLHGLVAHWQDYRNQEWLPRLLDAEDAERKRISLQRRIKSAKVGRFKPMADFDWSWPKSCDRELVEELFEFEFLSDAANVVVVGPNGIGKTMIAQNLAHQAVLRGVSVLFISASEMLNDLTARESGASLDRRLRKYTRPGLLAIDEVGYLSYGNRHADLLYEVVSRRYEQRSTIITTNKAFGEWNEIFPSASCVVTLIDRLVHRSEIVKLAGESYRLKEAKERAAKRGQRGTRGRPKVTARDLGVGIPVHA